METDGQRRWTFRDPQDRVVREYLEQGDVWSHERDFIYAPNGLLATRCRSLLPPPTLSFIKVLLAAAESRLAVPEKS